MVAHPFAAWPLTMAVLLLLVMGLLEYHGRYIPPKRHIRNIEKLVFTCCVGEMSADTLKESHSPCCFFRDREVLFPTSSSPISADHLGQGIQSIFDGVEEGRREDCFKAR